MPGAAHRLLVDAATLAAHLDDPAWVLFDCRFDLADPDWGLREYAAGHIPGARYAHLDLDLSSPIAPGTGRHPLPDPNALMTRLGEWGMGNTCQAVVYDHAGGAFAVRLWWLLRWLGHTRVAVLDGGLGAWLAEGRPLDAEPVRPSPRRFAGHADPAARVRIEDLMADLGRGRYRVIDARTAERFRGEVEPIDTVAGHIPGAVNLPLAGNLGPDGRFLPPERLRERFLAKTEGIEPQRVVHSCGSGVNACHNLLAMEIAGLTGSRLYAGSWSEWIRSPERPVATGDEGA
jgi:thiosulfate/3-mercaptopyruvate sulfurtransferase